jgi:hypothetical protein
MVPIEIDSWHPLEGLPARRGARGGRRIKIGWWRISRIHRRIIHVQLDRNFRKSRSELGRALRLKRLHQPRLPQVNAVKIRFAHRAVALIPGGLINGERSFVFFVCEQKRLPAACGSQRSMCGVE